MDVGVKVDVTGLLNKSKRGQELFQSTGLIKAVGNRQLKWINDNFKSRGALVGGWKPLAPFTLAHRMHGGDAPLQDIGNFKASFNSQVLSSSEVKVGSPAPFASYHEEGTGPILPVNAKALAIPGPGGISFLRRTAGIPKRKVLPPISVAKELAIKIIKAEIRKIDNG